jgi:hypothetical protein
MDHTRRVLSAAIALSSLGMTDLAFAQGKGQDKDKEKGGGQGKAKGAKHKNGKDLLGEKVKVNGNHKLGKNGAHEVSVDVKDGKIAAFHAKHDTKGEVPIKKYKTNKKMAALDAQRSPIVLVQYQYVGTTWIGYSYIDEYGYEDIYWYPYDMILDGDTGAVEYIAAY